eukprot:322561-Chlamydomonas_euryale.AAC.18
MSRRSLVRRAGTAQLAYFFGSQRRGSATSRVLSYCSRASLICVLADSSTSAHSKHGSCAHPCAEFGARRTRQRHPQASKCGDEKNACSRPLMHACNHAGAIRQHAARSSVNMLKDIRFLLTLLEKCNDGLCQRLANSCGNGIQQSDQVQNQPACHIRHPAHALRFSACTLQAHVKLTVDLRDLTTTTNTHTDIKVLEAVAAQKQDRLKSLHAQHIRGHQLQGGACTPR